MSLSTYRYILGIPVEFVCESDRILQMVYQIYPNAEIFSNSREAQIRPEFKITLGHSLRRPQELCRPAKFEVNHHYFTGESGGSHFHANRITNSGNAMLCDRILKNEYLLRHQVLNAIGYYLLTYRFFLPIHAACFEFNKQLILCLGESGVGKSTLAAAAMNMGLPVFAEDICFIGTEPDYRIEADCREFHLYTDSYTRYFDGQQSKSEITHNGKSKHIIQNKTLCSNRNAISNLPPLVLFLHQNHAQRRSKITKLEDLSPFRSLELPQEAGFDLISNVRVPVINWLKTRPCYKGTIGSCFDDFLTTIEDLREQPSCVSR